MIDPGRVYGVCKGENDSCKGWSRDMNLRGIYHTTRLVDVLFRVRLGVLGALGSV